jgi:hypothetical protein
VKAVLRLIVTYFTGTPLLRGITLLGVIGVVGGSAAFLSLPPLLGSQGGPSRFQLWQETLLTLAPIGGLLCVVFGPALLPALFSRLASSHYVYVLPHGRMKLLVSALVTLTLVGLVAALTITVYYYRSPLALERVFERAFVVSLLTATLLYVVLWLKSRSSSAMGLLVGSLATIATLVLPIRFIAWPSRPLAAYWILWALLWCAFGAGFMLAPRHKAALGRLKQTLTGRSASATYDGGGEIDFLIGTARPWALALGQVVPILIATYFLNGFQRNLAPSAPSPWLFFLTILSILSGAVASLAATRSRGLWLRAHWTRAELFRRVEDTFWRHNSYALGVLLLMLVGVGTYFYLPTATLAFGMGLLMLGTALSTYLGLMMTRRIGWIEAALAVATMLALMLVAVYASAPGTPPARIVALEALLVAATLLFRDVARRRWTNLDWMLCRADAHVRAST